jgi:hypothetical protein
MIKPEDFRKEKIKALRNHFVASMAFLKEKEIKYRKAFRIGQEWEESKKGRLFVLDTTVPFHLNLILNETDTLKDCIFFIESLDIGSIELGNDENFLKGNLTYYFLGFCTLFFKPNKKGICRIEYKKVSKIIHVNEPVLICQE